MFNRRFLRSSNNVTRAHKLVVSFPHHVAKSTGIPVQVEFAVVVILIVAKGLTFGFLHVGEIFKYSTYLVLTATSDEVLSFLIININCFTLLSRLYHKGVN